MYRHLMTCSRRLLPQNQNTICLPGLTSKAHLCSVKPATDSEVEDTTFETLFKNSDFVKMGSGKNTKIRGTVFEVHDEHLYIDFGGKFHGVCDIPRFTRQK